MDGLYTHRDPTEQRRTGSAGPTLSVIAVCSLALFAPHTTLAHAQSPGPTPPVAPAPPAADAPAPTSVVPPHLVYVEDPIYPPSELGSGTHPSVVFQVVLDRDGTVRSADVEHSAGESFDSAAAEALARWRFEPARRGGEAIASRVRVTVHFELPRFDVPTTEAHAHDLVAVEGDGDGEVDTASDGERHRVDDPASDSEAEEGDVVEASATTTAAPLRNTSRAVSDFQLDRAALDLAPHRDAGQLLEAAPGMVVMRPEGDAVAHRILLRGFDAEHGQNIELSVEGLPLNQPSHLHGQGYADLGFIVPEAVRSIRVTEGVYDPSQGDFAIAGSADFDLGVTDRGVTAISQMGSFRTFREVLIIAPEGQDDDTFVAIQARRTSGFGTHRAGMSASGLAQWGFSSGAWRFRVLGALAGSRSDLGGVVRRDDIGTVGYYGTYDQPTARAQSAFGARVLTAFLGEHRGANGATSDFAVHLGVTDFQLRSNFTGYLEVSSVDPTLRGLGDLIEQRNRAATLGMRFRHRSAAFHPVSWLRGTLEVGSTMRLDQTEQSQTLLTQPGNVTWDRRFDASVLGADLGFYVDADLALGDLVSLRGGVRADALAYDVDDRLANTDPAITAAMPGARRTAFGLAAGPRVTLEVHPHRGPTYVASYGEGYRSPHAATLIDGQRAPYTKVRSADLGLRTEHRFGDGMVRVHASGFLTQVSNDVVFEPSENAFGPVGASRRAGAVVAAELSAWDIVQARVSFTGAHATLLDPPAPSEEDPTPAFQPGTLVPYVPPIVIRADVGAAHSLGRLGGRDVRGSIGIGYSYVGARPMPYATRSPAISLLDAQASITWRGIELGVSGQNLLGRRYATAESAFVSNWDPTSVASRAPERTISAGAPRTLMLTLGVRP